jgi:hypothetical protein
MQLFDQLQSTFTALYQDKKRFALVCCLAGVLILGGILASVFLTTGVPGANQSATVGQSSNSSSGLGFGKNNAKNVPTIIPTRTPEEIAYLTAIPAAPTDIQFLTKKDLDEFRVQPTPTPTPLPGIFYTPNGQQNDLEIRYYYENAGDSFDQIRIRNNKTTEERLIGYIYHYTPGDPAFFSKDFSQIYFIGGAKNDFNKISVYSIAQDRIAKEITLDQMKIALPNLQIDKSAVLTMLSAPPDKSKIAFSYGNTFGFNRIVPNTNIIVINLTNNKMQLLPVKGLVSGWKDNTTLMYEVNTTDPNANNKLEVQVTGI